ncbi:MAG: hypothetical protein ABSG43_14230 [Solirubrobacteraceae bacterium]
MSGVPPALAIEAVEWLEDGRDLVTLRVTGRWPRRRPGWSGEPVLVVEVEGQRHRIPAMPESPRIDGIALGMWRISFSVPAVIVERSVRAWLQLGAVAVPLPPRSSAAEPRAMAWAVRRQAVEVGDQLRDQVEQLDRQVRELTAQLAEQRSARRAAEQRAHAERSMRVELVGELANGNQAALRTALGDLATAEQRIRELEAELELLGRRLAEAEQLLVMHRARTRADTLARVSRERPAGGVVPADARMGSPRPVVTSARRG